VRDDGDFDLRLWGCKDREVSAVTNAHELAPARRSRVLL
jgi:hypothetical protein